MRVDESVVIDAPVEDLWEMVSDLPGWGDLLANATRWEHAGGPESGLGARYQLRLKVASAEVGSLIEVVECDAPGDLAWTSITGLDQRGRWRLRETDDGQTRASLRLSYQAPGGLLATTADLVSSPIVAGSLRETLERLKRQAEGDRYMGDGRRDGGLLDGVSSRVEQAVVSVRTAVSAGLVKPMRPDKVLRSLRAVQKWGYTPATGYIANAVRFPDQDAIVDDLGRLTFAELQDRTNRLASSLADAAVLEGDGVAIMCRNHRYFVESVVALSKLGAHALFLNTAFAGPQLTEVVKREKPVAIIYDEEFTELLEDAGKRRKRFLAWTEDDTAPADPTLEELVEAGDPDDLVPPEESGRVVILTSGTTGTPKGASRKQAESIGPAIALLSRIPLKTHDRALIAAPLFHSWGFAHFTLGMALSHTLILQRRFKPEDTLAGIAQHQAQSCPMVPVMVQRIMDLPEETRRKYDTSSLRAVPLSGSALPGELAIRFMDEFGDILYNLYGSTEVAWATIATPDDLRAAPGTAGKPPIGTTLRIYDGNGNELPPGREGRIFVANEMLFEGYTGGGSKDVIDGLMSTGDVGYIDEEERLFVSGRDDEMIVSGGENVFPREVEDTISNMKGVSEVAVIGVDDEDWGQRLKAFVVKQGKSGPSEDEIKKHVKSNLAGYKVPREVEYMDELPRNATGKVLKRELQEREEGEGDEKKSSSKKRKKAGSKS